MQIKKLAVLAVSALITGLVAVPATTASANHNGALTVVVGEGFGLGANCDPQTGQGCEGFGESQRFLAPNPTNVHDGDTITFAFHGFHTATVLPANTDVQDFIDTQVRPFGAPYSLVVPDPDEGATGLKANPAVAFPSSFTCGTPTAPCPAGGNEVVNSGLPQTESFSVVIDAQPGDTIWVICLLHPHMRMRIKVVGNNAAATTPAEVTAAHAAQTALDQDWGHAMHGKMRAKRSSHVGADGIKVWDSWVGVDNHHASLFNIYPLNLPVKRGERVRYHFDNLTYEDHTAAVRNATTIEQAAALFAIECDPDGDAGSAPDTEPVDGACANPLQTEISFPFALAGPQGDGNVAGRSDVEASGLRGANAPTPPTAGEASWTVRYTRPADAPIPMFCQLHPFMVQRVRVRR